MQSDIKDATRYRNEMFNYAEKEAKINSLLERFKQINSRQKGKSLVESLLNKQQVKASAPFKIKNVLAKNKAQFLKMIDDTQNSEMENSIENQFSVDF